jgi:(p)ppGpp synthase/HD superfamily hydrolase
MTDIRLGPRFLAAVSLAARLHDGQVRKGTGVPYLSHPLGVASLVLEAGADEDEAIADIDAVARLSPNYRAPGR